MPIKQPQTGLYPITDPCSYSESVFTAVGKVLFAVTWKTKMVDGWSTSCSVEVGTGGIKDFYRGWSDCAEGF